MGKELTVMNQGWKKKEEGVKTSGREGQVTAAGGSEGMIMWGRSTSRK